MCALSIAFELIFSYEPKSNKPGLDFAFGGLDCIFIIIIIIILLFLSRHETVINTAHIDPFTDRKELKRNSGNGTFCIVWIYYFTRNTLHRHKAILCILLSSTS